MGVDCTLFVHRSISVKEATSALAILAGNSWKWDGSHTWLEVDDVKVESSDTSNYCPYIMARFGRFMPSIGIEYPVKIKGKRRFDFYGIRFGSYAESIKLCRAFVEHFGGAVDEKDSDSIDCDIFVKPHIWNTNSDEEFGEFQQKLAALPVVLNKKEQRPN